MAESTKDTGMMQELFEHNRDFTGELLRNIVSLRLAKNLFDDLLDDPDELEVLTAAEMRIKADSKPGLISRGFHYSTAIEYPFRTEPFMASRYGDGRYPVWYGSLELDTTIYETAWHMRKELLGIEGLHEVVRRERAVYQVDCHALLLDLSNKIAAFPALVEDNYAFTQQIGHRLQGEGHPGLLSPSARRPAGINAAIFREEALNNPRILCYLSYFFDPRTEEIRIERAPGETFLCISYGD